ncbi:Pyruvate kinase PKM [Thelohanellus kitauei]|uniref:Pyruvate kinase n=1 Tax=Thelohanellus kitauei TaxID=669202 RepID=A0A0C2ML28_THEKT|nr:Pyruvate kinase PKM [Thelohanellus kitauei]
MNIVDGELRSATKDQYSSEFLESHVAYNKFLDVYDDYPKFKCTGTICTIGPACSNSETIREMIREGMCIACFDFSRGSHKDQKILLNMVKSGSLQFSENHQLALAIDIKGPEIRIGMNQNNAHITLLEGKEVIVTTDESYKDKCTFERLYIDFHELIDSINAGQQILIDDGRIVLKAKELGKMAVLCDILCGGTLCGLENVILPRINTNLPIFSEKNIKDIRFAVEERFDIVMVFIRKAQNVKDVRQLLDETEHGRTMRIVSKIENYEGVENIEEIIEESDSIMVFRNRLALDLDNERSLIAQKKIISLCNLSGKYVICSGQILESMLDKNIPTVAEISDGINSVLDGTDCLMLFNETAYGKYPVQAAKTLKSICLAAENMNQTRRHFESIKNSLSCMTHEQATAMAAVDISYNLRVDGIIVLTTTGRTAQLISMFHPRCFVFALTRCSEVARSLHLYRNVCPIIYTRKRVEPWTEDIEARVTFTVNYALKNEVFKVGSKFIIITGWKPGPGFSNTIRIGCVQSNSFIDGVK